MSDLTDRAIARITEECQKKEYLIPFEEYLTSIMTDRVAGKVLDEKKTLQGCFDEMKKAAEKHMVRNGNVGTAYIPPGKRGSPSSGAITASTLRKKPARMRV